MTINPRSWHYQLVSKLELLIKYLTTMLVRKTIVKTSVTNSFTQGQHDVSYFTQRLGNLTDEKHDSFCNFSMIEEAVVTKASFVNASQSCLMWRLVWQGTNLYSTKGKLCYTLLGLWMSRYEKFTYQVEKGKVMEAWYAIILRLILLIKPISSTMGCCSSIMAGDGHN